MASRKNSRSELIFSRLRLTAGWDLIFGAHLTQFLYIKPQLWRQLSINMTRTWNWSWLMSWVSFLFWQSLPCRAQYGTNAANQWKEMLHRLKETFNIQWRWIDKKMNSLESPSTQLSRTVKGLYVSAHQIKYAIRWVALMNERLYSLLRNIDGIQSIQSIS